MNRRESFLYIQRAANSPLDSEARRQHNHFLASGTGALIGLCDMFGGIITGSSKNYLFGLIIFASMNISGTYRRRKLIEEIKNSV